MRACWLKWVGRDWSISADYIWLNYSDANSFTTVLIIYVVNMMPLNPRIDTAQPFASPPSHVSSSGLLLLI